jgi:flagellar biosynthetic protein FlhB
MSEERTEAPTPKRKEEIRKRGQTARSQDLTSAAVLLAGLYGIKFLAGKVHEQVGSLLVGNILAIGDFDTSAPPDTGMDVFPVLYGALFPLLGLIAISAIVVSSVQGGFLFAPNLLFPKSGRVNPFAGAKRLVSMQGLMQVGKSMAKLTAVSVVAGITIYGHLDELAGLGAIDLATATRELLDLIWAVLFRSALAMLGLGLVDWLWERRRYMQSARMTKQEVIEETRQSEGDPHVRAQQKGKRMQFLQQMMQDVRTADVVVTNPTHYAVALRYDPETMAAPIVIAKGQDFIAQRIRETAHEARVPVLSNPPLARALHKMVPVGKEVPPHLYVAVAEILAFVFRLRAEQKSA